MIRQPVLVSNRLGLHARAAAKLVRLASRFSSDIYLSREGANQQIEVVGKKIRGMMKNVLKLQGGGTEKFMSGD